MKPFNKEKCEEKEVKIGDIIMHGDVIIEKISDLPGRFKALRKCEDNCLAYGEATGHLHQLGDGEFDVRVDNQNPNNRFIVIETPTALRHQEHKIVILPPGNYRSRIQRERDPFSRMIREVAD